MDVLWSLTFLFGLADAVLGVLCWEWEEYRTGFHFLTGFALHPRQTAPMIQRQQPPQVLRLHYSCPVHQRRRLVQGVSLINGERHPT